MIFWHFCESDDIAREIDESETISATVIDYKCLLESSVRNRLIWGTTCGCGVRACCCENTPLRLELKRFKGDVTCWITFWDTFKAAVHENVNIILPLPCCRRDSVTLRLLLRRIWMNSWSYRTVQLTDLLLFTTFMIGLLFILVAWVY